MSEATAVTAHPFNLTGRTALVTGAGRGLGREIALGLAAAGARVLLNGRNAAPLEAVAAKIAGGGGLAAALPFDLTDDGAVQAALAAAEPIDILVNNAGLRDRRPLSELDPDAVRRVLDGNLLAAFALSRRVAGAMVARRWGRIITLTSIAAHASRGGDAAYVMAKAGQEGMTRALAAELGPAGVTVNAIAPGWFATEANAEALADPSVGAWLEGRTSVGRWGRPEEIAGAAVFLASDAASYVTGQTMVVDGGFLTRF